MCLALSEKKDKNLKEVNRLVHKENATIFAKLKAIIKGFIPKVLTIKEI